MKYVVFESPIKCLASNFLQELVYDTYFAKCVDGDVENESRKGDLHMLEKTYLVECHVPHLQS